MSWSVNGCDLIRWILNGSDPKILQLWFYVAMYWHLLCWNLYLVLWIFATLIFSLQFFHMNVVIKENFPKPPYLIVRYSIFWLVLISLYFFNVIYGYCWIIILFIGLFFYENISFCMRIFFILLQYIPLQRTGKILVRE